MAVCVYIHVDRAIQLCVLLYVSLYACVCILSFGLCLCVCLSVCWCYGVGDYVLSVFGAWLLYDARKIHVQSGVHIQ